LNLLVPAVYAQGGDVDIGFTPPSIQQVLGFLIQIFFVVAGLVALIYLLLGALSWITSGGNKENVTKAQEKIQAAVLGLILIVAVLAIIVTLEQIVFNKEICLGISCPIKIPSLIQ
jgi:cytochrome bd-type quinol oxidase subunit 2